MREVMTQIPKQRKLAPKGYRNAPFLASNGQDSRVSNRLHGSLRGLQANSQKLVRAEFSANRRIGSESPGRPAPTQQGRNRDMSASPTMLASGAATLQFR